MTTTTPTLVFVGTATISTRPDARAWDVGIVTRTPDGHETRDQWFINLEDLDLGNADLSTLLTGRFHDRHPHAGDHASSGVDYGDDRALDETDVLRRFEQATRGAVIISTTPSDIHVLADRMRWHNLCPSWRTVVDAVAFAAGAAITAPPWNLDDLATAHGIRIDDEDQHTALGDARVVRDLYDAALTTPTERIP